MSLFSSDQPNLVNLFTELRKDLLSPSGPSLSTTRNHRFALLPYEPKRELEVQDEAHRLADDLGQEGWSVLSLSLSSLFLDRVRAQGESWCARLIEKERALHAIDPERSLQVLHNYLSDLMDRENQYYDRVPMGALADDCAQRIAAGLSPQGPERTLVLLMNAAAIHPFFHAHAFLSALHGRTHNAPVVLLYPGEYRDQARLSFMGVREPDHDYRSRIYR